MADWDLHAVVRGYTTTTTTTTAIPTATATSFLPDFYSQSCLSSFGIEQQQNGNLFSFSDPFETRSAMEELHELYKPFFHQSQPLSPQSIITTPISPLSSSLSLSTVQPQIIQKSLKPQQPKQSHVTTGSVTSAKSTTTTSNNPRSKRRKNQLKKVCQVPVEALSSDVWAWRKYGQKPIKGSPYPRGYYRCSSSKGCLARKQVERNRSDPGMFIVTYTAEHNHPAPTHRNSLAGSTRQKPFTTQRVTASETNKPTCSSSSPSTSNEDQEVVPQSTNTQSIEEEEKEIMEDDDEEVDFGISDMAVSDDFFEGLEGLDSPVTGDYLSDQLPASFGLPWISNYAATTAGSGI